MSEDLLQKLHNDIALFRKDFDNAMVNFGQRFDKLSADLKEIENYLSNEIRPKTHTWDQTSANVSKVVWLIVSSVVVGLLAVIGLK